MKISELVASVLRYTQSLTTVPFYYQVLPNTSYSECSVIEPHSSVFASYESEQQ